MCWCYLCGRFWYMQRNTIAGTTVVLSKVQFLKSPAMSRSHNGLAELIDWPCPECDPNYDPTA